MTYIDSSMCFLQLYKTNDVNQVRYETIINRKRIDEFVCYVVFFFEILSDKVQKVICNFEIASVRKYVFLVEVAKFETLQFLVSCFRKLENTSVSGCSYIKVYIAYATQNRRDVNYAMTNAVSRHFTES
jgi:beta-glucosidase/6-phospho-beta-glucosidase/beta-galactosidase